MRHLHIDTYTPSPNTVSARIRIKPAMHLCTGDAVGAFAEHARGFEDRPKFNMGSNTKPQINVLDWISRSIQDLAVICETLAYNERPIILPIPASALSQPGLIEACTQAIAQTRFAHQEISFEIKDCAIASSTYSLQWLITNFRKIGFRVSIDARKSWAATLPAPCWLMIDTLRVFPHQMDTETELEDMIANARAAGVAIVAEKPFWRDGEYLASLGIDYGLSPFADA